MRESVEIQLTVMKTNPSKRKNIFSAKVLQSRHAILILTFGCALCVMLISILNHHGSSKPIDKTVFPNGHDARPFSDRDPVRDLGVMEFTRPLDTSPPQGLFRRSEESLFTTQRQATPTNAWYQNMLMVRGEPSNLQRAYSIPYLVDVTGVIPGLRVHHNRIVASTAVMQLSFNDQFGLTLGATGDLQKGSKGTYSYNYTVLETAELGVTLQWVRAFMIRIND
jgi:hypothetical protein